MGPPGAAGQAFEPAGYQTSYSATALAADGLTPGATVDAGGLAFTWPNLPSCTKTNHTNV